MDKSKHKRRMIVLLVIAVCLTLQHSTGAQTAPRAKKLVLIGTVTSIFQVNAPPPSRRNWGVTVRVEKVTTGDYSDPTFTFTVHSPARSGVSVGLRCTIVATWNGQEYIVDETRQIRCEETRP